MKRLIIVLIITTIVFVVTNEGFCEEKSISIELMLPQSNSNPIAADDHISICGNVMNSIIDVQSNDNDPDGDLLTTSILTAPLHGVASVIGNKIKYIANQNYTGSDIITYIVTDNSNPSLSDTAELYVTVMSSPIFSLGIDKTICRGDSITIGTPAIQGLTYNWTPTIGLNIPNSAQPKASPFNTTNYILAITNTTTGCISTDTLSIVVNELPIADAGNGDTICLGVNVLLGTPAIDGNIYHWENGIGLDSVDIAQPSTTPIVGTTYFLTVTDINTGCSQIDSVEIVLSPSVEANAGNLVKICVGDNTSIGAMSLPGYAYSWLPSEYLDSDTIANPVASPIETTFYQLTVTDSISGCESIDLVEVRVFEKPIVLPGFNEAICLGDSVMIGVAQDTSNTYTWSPASTLSSPTEHQPMAHPKKTTEYTISASNPGCKVQQEIIVTIIPAPPINAGKDTLVCAGIAKKIGSPEIIGNTYSWLPADALSATNIAQPLVTITETSTFYLSVTDDSTGCIAKDNVKLTVTSSFPNAVLQNETINQGESVIIGSAPSYGINYNWSPATGLNSTTVSQPVAQPNATTTYTVTQTDMNGCTLKETLTVNVLQDPICDSTFYDGFSPNGDGVDDYWNIPLLTCYPVNEVTIINRWGNEVWKKTNYDNQSVRWIGQNMNGQDLADGIYYYNIVYQEKQKTGWILLKR